MNKDEIKEILDILKRLNNEYSLNSILDFEEYEISNMQLKQLLDYITNLQEENQRLKEENKHIFANVNDDQLLRSNAMNYAELKDYKTRNEKAIELINKYSNYPTYYLTGNIVKDLLNILQGKSDE